MATIVTSDAAEFSAISMDAKMGRSTVRNAAAPRGPPEGRRPRSRPSTTNNTTGIATVPMNPSGSRTKILISSQVSVQSPRSIFAVASIPNRVARQLQEHIFERRPLRPEIRDVHSMLGEAADHLRHEIVAASPNRDLSV